jgi:hypothetical protein
VVGVSGNGILTVGKASSNESKFGDGQAVVEGPFAIEGQDTNKSASIVTNR